MICQSSQLTDLPGLRQPMTLVSKVSNSRSRTRASSLREMQSKIKDCRHGRFMYLPNDAYIGRSLDVYGEYCEGESEIFRQLLRPGDVALDVGANIGALTVGMARTVQSAGAVVAFEPQRAIY